jgi:hypothetical protein
LEPGAHDQPSRGGATRIESPEKVQRRPGATADSGVWRQSNSEGEENGEEVPEHQQLTRSTVVPAASSEEVEGVGIAGGGDGRSWEGRPRFGRLGAPRGDSAAGEDQRATAELMAASDELGNAGNDGSTAMSPAAARTCVEKR